jgi:hypothetical protein
MFIFIVLWEKRFVLIERKEKRVSENDIKRSFEMYAPRQKYLVDELKKI